MVKREREGAHFIHMLERGENLGHNKKREKIWVKRSWLGSKIGEKRGFYGGVWA